MSEINVTPLVDVMLVLLTVFIVTAPLIMQTIPVQLPRAASTPARAELRTIRISVAADGEIAVDHRPVAAQDVEAALKHLGARPDVSVEIHADSAAAYGQVARVMAQVQRAGIIKFAFVTLPEHGTGGPPGR